MYWNFIWYQQSNSKLLFRIEYLKIKTSSGKWVPKVSEFKKYIKNIVNNKYDTYQIENKLIWWTTIYDKILSL